MSHAGTAGLPKPSAWSLRAYEQGKGGHGLRGATLVVRECVAVEAAALTGRVGAERLDRLSSELDRAATALRAQPV